MVLINLYYLVCQLKHKYYPQIFPHENERWGGEGVGLGEGQGIDGRGSFGAWVDEDGLLY